MGSDGRLKRTARHVYEDRGFWALIVTQFQGAFNDNCYRMLIVLFLPLLLYPEFPTTEIAFLLFNIGYLLFPGLLGALSDRYSKQAITVVTKYLELGIMAAALVAFWFANPWFMLILLFLMGVQSAFFSPSKYGILPEILPPGRLPWGNGYMQMGTFAAIILGQALAGLMYDHFQHNISIAGLFLLGFTLIGLVSAHFVTRPAPAEPTRPIPINPWKGLFHYLGQFYADRWLFLTLMGVTYFWFVGALVMQNIIEYGQLTLRTSLSLGFMRLETGALIGLLSATLSLGIGVGSVAAGYLSRGRIEPGLAPLGAVGLVIFSVLLALTRFNIVIFVIVHGLAGPQWAFPVVYATQLVLMLGLGASAGLFVVPLSAMLQHRCPKNAKGGMIASLNFVTFSGMTVAALCFLALHTFLGVSPYGVFLIAGIMTLFVSLVFWYTAPVFMLRFLAWSRTRLSPRRAR